MRITLITLPFLATLACAGAATEGGRPRPDTDEPAGSFDARPRSLDGPSPARDASGAADAAPAVDAAPMVEAAPSAEAGADGTTADATLPSDLPPSGRGPAGYLCPAGASYGSPLPASRTATLIRGGFDGSILEGPAWVEAQEALYFTEVRGTSSGRIHKYTPASGQLVVFASNLGVAGLALDPQGMLVAASHDRQRLTRFDPATGARSDVPGGAMYMDRPFNQVNDAVVRADGNMYFSDPTYQLAGRQGQGAMAFYRLSPTGMVSRIVTATNANGVALSPDGGWLYLSTTGGPSVQRFALAGDGGIMGGGMAFAAGSSDGMAVDCAGNVYLTGGGVVRVVSSTGQAVGTIGGLDQGFVTNCAFGGADHRTLFITTSTALYKIPLQIPGFPN